nr:hypothetical protein [Tissierella sp.]
MKKLLIILGLSFSILVMHGCVRDKDGASGDAVNPDNKPDIDIKEDISKEEPQGEEVKVPIEESPKQEDVLYENTGHGFNLRLPGWWSGSYKIEEEAWFDEVSTSVSFNFEDGDIYSNIFTVIIFDETIKYEEWDDPFLIYIAEKGGKTYAYLQAMEPPVDVLEEENDKYLRTISKMVEEVPGIIETFKIEN